VDGATVIPSFVSSPWIRRYPHAVESPSPAGQQGEQCSGLLADGQACVGCWCRTFPAASLRCQARSAASVTGKISVQRLRGKKPGQRGEAHPVSRLVPHTPGVTAQHRVLVPEHQQLSLLRPVPAEHQDSQAEYPANQQADDLEKHPAWRASTTRVSHVNRKSACSELCTAASGASCSARRRPVRRGRARSCGYVVRGGHG